MTFELYLDYLCQKLVTLKLGMTILKLGIVTLKPEVVILKVDFTLEWRHRIEVNQGQADTRTTPLLIGMKC